MYCHYQLSDVIEEYCEAYSSNNLSLVREALQYLFINVTRWKYIKNTTVKYLNFMQQMTNAELSG